ncbi:hypothetical protein J5Y09_18230 [Roseomonas sp. PWR1]|uniref:Transposase n=1 Tax=Roseomonas nitratireducens TaxID=2820810 RepID=A0ABS4AWX9_9PROT|nr:hypothetical protein [Neoroseomonas nitratireducens]MBP0465870.1 hypothetical protein [Neoroseomonas nitratireducens]
MRIDCARIDTTRPGETWLRLMLVTEGGAAPVRLLVAGGAPERRQSDLARLLGLLRALQVPEVPERLGRLLAALQGNRRRVRVALATWKTPNGRMVPILRSFAALGVRS